MKVKIVKKIQIFKFDSQIWFCSFLLHESSEEATDMQGKVQSFHEVQR
jgi:hypothetical protein